MKIVDGKIKLTARERAAFFACDWPELADQGKPPELVETHYALSPRLSFTVRTIHRTKKGYRLEYDVTDDREERFLLMPAAATIPIDDDGQMLEGLPPEEEIGYTRNPKRRVVDDLPTVRPDVQKVLDMRGRLHTSQHDRANHAEREAERDLQRVQAEIRDLAKRAVRMGVDPMVALAPVARAIDEGHEGLGDEAA